MRKQGPIRVAFFTPDFRTSHDQVFCAQVLGQAGALRAAGFECMLISSELNDESVKAALSMPQLQAFSQTNVLPIYPLKPNSLKFYKVAHIAAKLAASDVIKWNPDIVYVRGSAAFRPALKLASLTNAKVVYDARGLVAEESFMKRGKWNLLAYYHRYRELEAFRKSDILMCVSNRFRDYLKQTTGRRDISVVPCCIDSSKFRFKSDVRKIIRRQLGWSIETPVVAYCGGLSHWQRIDDVLQLMVNMKSLEPTLKFLLMVSDPSTMTSLALQAGLSSIDFNCMRVPHEVIPDWLSAADAGVILRHDLLLNNVASPVKIAEYLACGLPVICSSGIGDLSDLIKKEQVGVVLTDGDTDFASKALELVRKALREPNFKMQAQQLAHKMLSWSSQIDTYRFGYGLEKQVPLRE
jgi:glycosyltransferase involved in cell wall biosynthesis